MHNEQRFSGSLGHAYDIFWEAVPWHDEFQSIIPVVLSQSIHKKIQLIEAGFGTGITTEKVLHSSDSTILAIDNEPNMLAKAKEYLGDQAKERVRFTIGDLLSVLQKLPAASFDGFYSAYVLHNIPQRVRKTVFQEIYRVLRPGGVYVNADKIAYDDSTVQRRELALQLARLNIFLEKYHDPDYYLEWIQHYLRDEEEDLIFREREQGQLLEENGFEEIRVVFRKALECVCVAKKRV